MYPDGIIRIIGGCFLNTLSVFWKLMSLGPWADLYEGKLLGLAISLFFMFEVPGFILLFFGLRAYHWPDSLSPLNFVLIVIGFLGIPLLIRSIYSYNMSQVNREADPMWECWVIAILSFVVIVLLCIVNTQSKQKKEQEERFRQIIKDNENRFKKEMSDFHAALSKKYGNRYLYELAGAPNNHFVDDDLLPHSSIFIPEDIYTFYLGGSPNNYSTKYHNKSCRYGKSEYEINAYTLRKNRRRYDSCMLCACGLPDTVWVDRYQKLCSILERYITIDHQADLIDDSIDNFDPLEVLVNHRNYKRLS